MSILDLCDVPSPRSQLHLPRPNFVSTQVSEARRYFIDLTPRRTRHITVVCGGCERVRPDYVIQRRTFPFLAVEFVAEGEGELELAGRSYNLGPGMAFAYGPDVPHVIRCEPSRPMLKYYVDFCGTEAERLLASTPLGGWRAVQMSAPGEIVELFELLQREGANESAFGAQSCAALIPVLLLKISERALPGGRAEPRAWATYQRAKRWIEEHYLQVSTAEEAASACHLDTAYMCRLFQRFGHTTPYRFLMRQKMNRATELLLDRGMLVKEAAAELGFGDAFQFSRAFKRVYGLPPERFVRHAHGGEANP